MTDTRTRPPANHVETDYATPQAHALDQILGPPGGRAGWATARTRRGYLCAWVDAPGVGK
ncbi:MAG: hypothetical protein JWO15_3873 [Sphingomonadales bacterium]|nr:hypothetical protein [Sphingomonadales bacterium]